MRRPSGGKRYSVALPRNMLLLTLLAFFVMPLIMGVYMLFRQLFAVGGGGVASRYAVHPPQHVNLAPTVAGAAEGESAVSGPPPSSVPSVDVSGAPAGREDPSEAEEAEGGLSLSGEDGGQNQSATAKEGLRPASDLGEPPSGGVTPSDAVSPPPSAGASTSTTLIRFAVSFPASLRSWRLR